MMANACDRHQSGLAVLAEGDSLIACDSELGRYIAGDSCHACERELVPSSAARDAVGA
jgi:hypothetical protein